MFKIGSFGIITDEQDRVLLCHRRDHDLWNLPGGGVGDGETPDQAVMREIKEEIGLEAKVVRLTGVYNKPDKNSVVFSFLCEVVGGAMTLTDEADEIKYFSLDDLPKNASQKQIERIGDYFADKNKVHYKTQLGPSSIDLIKQHHDQR